MTIEYRKSHFFGIVGAPFRRCTIARKVSVFKARRHHRRKIGTDVTNHEGVWQVHHPHARGRFFARVRTVDVGEPGKPLVCSGDRSPTIRVP
ncbi:MAG: hypothetical protein M3290_07120 [Actinomycetota bacterium]|nr:hypothetical protein [Actinomycetota bacterium]